MSNGSYVTLSDNFLVNLIVKATLEDNITEDVEEHIRYLANECGLRL